jgi:hypothetical protein
MLVLLIACWTRRTEADSPVPRFEVAPMVTSPLALPARFSASLPDEASPYADGVDIAEVGRGLCEGNAALRQSWLAAVHRRLADGTDPTVVGLQWGGLAAGCRAHEFCQWARQTVASPDLSPSERSIVGSLSISCSEPEDLAIVGAALRDSVLHDDYPRVRGLVAVIQWQRDPSWIREQVRADLPLTRSDRVRDALAVALSQCGDDQSRGLVLDACIRRSGSDDADEQRLFGPCAYYADLVGTPTLMPDDTDPSWVRHPNADPVAFAARHPEAIGRLVAQLDTCVVDGASGAIDEVTTAGCLRAWMALDRPGAALRSRNLVFQSASVTRLTDELARFPTLAARNAAFASVGLPPSK